LKVFIGNFYGLIAMRWGFSRLKNFLIRREVVDELWDFLKLLYFSRFCVNFSMIEVSNVYDELKWFSFVAVK